MSIYKGSHDLSGYARSLPLLYSSAGRYRTRLARWMRQRKQKRALREARRETKRAGRLKLRHRLARLGAAIFGGGG